MIKHDNQNDWLLLKIQKQIPDEIVSFVESTFQIAEIRERAGTIRGIKFDVRTRENNHIIPHVHAEYDRYSISIAIKTGEVLAGNLPVAQQKTAKKWVLEHTEELLGKWSSITIAATSSMTESHLD